MESGIVTAIASKHLDEPVEPSGDGIEAAAGQFVLLPEEIKKELIEVLQCSVCLELPTVTNNSQVYICEKGHHFCKSCLERLTTCAVCRGKLTRGRNFVVEEVIMKLGKRLGIVEPVCYRAFQPPPIPKGIFGCAHVGCEAQSTAKAMLTHVRDAHRDHFTDKLRSNPQSGWFQAAFKARLSSNTKYVKSYQVSDMGLINVVVCIHQIENGSVPIDCYVQMLQLPQGFVYNLAITFGCHQWGVCNKDVCNYANAQESVQHFLAKVDESEDELYVNCLVRREGSLKPIPLNWPNVTNNVACTPSDRATRRTISRNERRKRIRRRFQEESNSILLQGLNTQ